MRKYTCFLSFFLIASSFSISSIANASTDNYSCQVFKNFAGMAIYYRLEGFSEEDTKRFMDLMVKDYLNEDAPKEAVDSLTALAYINVLLAGNEPQVSKSDKEAREKAFNSFVAKTIPNHCK